MFIFYITPIVIISLLVLWYAPILYIKITKPPERELIIRGLYRGPVQPPDTYKPIDLRKISIIKRFAMNSRTLQAFISYADWTINFAKLDGLPGLSGEGGCFLLFFILNQKFPTR